MEILSGVNHKTFIKLALALLSSFMLSGCAEGDLESPYAFPEAGLSSIVEDSRSLKADGFAAKLCVPDADTDLNTDGVEAEGYALFSVSDSKVLSQHNIYERVYPASTTKILTCLIALRYGNLDDIVTVPDDSAITVSGSSMADLEPGDKLTLKDLLYGLMVPSGNDAAVAVAHYISGSVDNFSELMNNTARDLGATHSHFVNPHGLPDEDHYTTVYDMYLIFNEAMKDETFRKIASTSSYEAVVNTASGSQNSERTVTWSSGNGFFSGNFSLPEGFQVTGGKTGHTNAAGFCLVLGSMDSQGDEYISIIYKASIYEQLYASMRKLVGKGAS